MKWRVDLVISILLALLSAAWYVTDCHYLGVRVRSWMVPAAAILPFIIVPAHRFYVTGAKQGALFLLKVVLFMVAVIALVVLIYSSLDYFCEPVMFGSKSIDKSGYFQFWGCF